MTVPPEAIEATARLLAVEFGGDWTDHEAAASELLAPAAPLIAAVERERIRQLAIDLAQTTYHKASGSQYHALGDFADLLAGDQP